MSQDLTTAVAVPNIPIALGARDRDRASVELPTLLLILGTYGAWLIVTRAYGHWPLIIVAPLLAVLLTLHSSLQHECVHGHPTRWERANRLLAVVPLSLWLPYYHYWRLHRRHHNDVRLTDPLDDPDWHVYYAVRTGVRYTGMPAWNKALGDQDMWKVTAFLTHLDSLPPAVQEYWKKAYGVPPRTGQEHHEHGEHGHED